MAIPMIFDSSKKVSSEFGEFTKNTKRKPNISQKWFIIIFFNV